MSKLYGQYKTSWGNDTRSMDNTRHHEVLSWLNGEYKTEWSTPHDTMMRSWDWLLEQYKTPWGNDTGCQDKPRQQEVKRAGWADNTGHYEVNTLILLSGQHKTTWLKTDWLPDQYKALWGKPAGGIHCTSHTKEREESGCTDHAIHGTQTLCTMRYRLRTAYLSTCDKSSTVPFNLRCGCMAL